MSRRRFLPLLFVLTLAAAPLLPAPAAALSLFGLKNSLIQFALDQINVPGSLEITVDKVEDPEEGGTDLLGVSIADAQGVWLRIGKVSMNWNPSRLVQGEVFVTKLTADDVEVLRKPVPAPPDPAAEKPAEDAAAGRLAWPRSPIAVTVEGMKLTRVRIAGGVLGPSPLAFDAGGHFRDEGDVQSAALSLDRTDAVTGTIRFDYTRNFQTDLLRLVLNAHEAPGGVVAELAGLPPDAAADVQVQGEAPVADWRAQMTAKIDDMGRVQGEVGVASVQPLAVTLDVWAQAEGQLQAQAAPWLADPVGLRADLTAREDGVLDLRDLVLGLNFGQVQAAGTFDPGSGAVDATAKIDVDRLGDPLVAFGTVEGLHFDGKVGGTTDRLTGDGRFRLASVRADALAVDDLDVKGQVTLAGSDLAFQVQGAAARLLADKLDLAKGRPVTLDLAGALAGKTLTLEHLALDGPVLTGKAGGTVELADQTLDLHYEVRVPDLTPVAGPYDVKAAGAVVSKGDFAGPFATARLKAATELQNFAMDGRRVGNARLQHDIALGKAITGAVRLAANTVDYGPVKATADLRLAGDSLTVTGLTADALGVAAAGDGPVSADLAAGLVEGRLNWRAADLKTLARLAGTDLAGRAEGSLALQPVQGRQDATVAMTLANGRAASARLSRLTVKAALRDALGAVPVVDATVHGEGIEASKARLGPVDLTLKGPLNKAALALKLAGKAPDDKPIAAESAAVLDLLGQPLTVTVSSLTASHDTTEARLLQPLTLTSGQGRTRVDGLRLGVPGGEIAGKADLLGQRLKAALTATFGDLGPLAKLASLPIEGGRLDAKVDYDSRAPASADLRFTDLQLADLPGKGNALGAQVTAAWDGREAKASAAISGNFGDPIRVDGTLGLRPGGLVPQPRKSAPLAGHVRWQGRLERLWALVPAADNYMAGAADVDLTLGGTFGAPTVAGRTDITNGRYENLQVGTVLTDLNARSSVGADGTYKVTLEAKDPSGAPVTGHVAVQGTALDAAIDTKKALLVRRADATALVTAAIKATGTLTHPDVKGDVLVDRAEIRLVHAVPPSIAELGEVRVKGAPKPKPKPKKEGRIGLDIRVHAPGNLFVRGRGLDSEWKMDLKVGGTASKPRVTGSIDKVRGQLSLLGKAFDLNRGQISFSDPTAVDPALDVALLRTSDGITGGITITGPASKPTMDFTSTPSLPQSEIMPRLLFGQSAQSLSPLQALDLANGIATLMDGGAGTLDRVRGAIGLDVLRVDNSGDSTGVTVGQNVAEGVFVGATQPIDGTPPKVRVEVEVLDDIVVDSEAGVQGNSSVGVKWRRDF
ncbi:MAG: translocation/assembly module TamB domain-containing protein [Alphaproteobacteria bacterium]|nr:translocation/assembly module TamB domain-containing protein [Alphaproteobacteria bacterium]MCB9927888.1 translocation/assembly module TamB domain-containing protein [Alphaproteobacteria bacterium]